MKRAWLLLLVGVAAFAIGRLSDRPADPGTDHASAPVAPISTAAPTAGPTPALVAPPSAADGTQAFALKRRDIFSKTPAANQALLKSLGYVTGTIDEHKELSGVIVHDRKKAFAGYNLYSSVDRNEALLLDMNGAVVHRWTNDVGQWAHVELQANGDLFVIAKDQGVFKVDKDSKPAWKYLEILHHDLWVDHETGNILVLYRREQNLPGLHPTLATFDEGVVVLDPQGKLVDRISFLRSLVQSPYYFLLPSVSHLVAEQQGGALDVLHSNHVELLDGSLSALGPLYKKGNLLVSLRNLSTIAILDGTSHQVIWVWGPSNLEYQHDPVMLSSGNILIFNNGAKESQVIELDPRTDRIVWRYATEGFYSHSRGSNQRLPNGNTLITESDTGYVFEVTPHGEVVWKFANPDVDPDGRRHAIWRMVRWPSEALTFLPKSASPH